MIYRKILKSIENFYNNNRNKALLITGARQIGKTYIIREYGKKNYKNFVEINFIENNYAKDIFNDFVDTKDLLTRLSAITSMPMIEGETLIFFDEVQECKNIVTAIKFLVQDSNFNYILSGSLLGVDLQDIKSIPVGYMDIMQMFPLDFEEFIIANGVSNIVIDSLKKSYENKNKVDLVVHNKMLDLFRLYLIVGGMPYVVEEYINSYNIKNVVEKQRFITNLYKKDITKYDPLNKLYIEDIFSVIPSELNAKNKRFIMKNLNENFKFSRYKNSFLWLKEAGVALPVFCANEPVIPLVLSKSTNLFKLFLSDVGLLSSMYMNNIQIKILKKEKDINFGAVYENAVAQELVAHGFNTFYFNSKKQGEIDFLIEHNANILPVEIKSGKDYSKHSALSNILNNEAYKIDRGIVLYNGNVEIIDKIEYLPIYMIMFIKNDSINDELYYKIDLSELM